MTSTPAQPAEAPAEAPAPRRIDARAFQRRAQLGEPYTLPGTGLVALLRRPSLMELATRGTVPNPLASAVMRLVAADKNPAELTSAQRIERWQNNAGAFVEIAAMCFVEPRMIVDRAPNYDAGEISPADISDLDYIWIYYTLVEGSADEIAPFRADS